MDQELVDWEARRHSKRSLADSCSEVPGLTISGTPQAASVRARMRDRYFMEVVTVDYLVVQFGAGCQIEIVSITHAFAMDRNFKRPFLWPEL